MSAPGGYPAGQARVALVRSQSGGVCVRADWPGLGSLEWTGATHVGDAGLDQPHGEAEIAQDGGHGEDVTWLAQSDGDPFLCAQHNGCSGDQASDRGHFAGFAPLDERQEDDEEGINNWPICSPIATPP